MSIRFSSNDVATMINVSQVKPGLYCFCKWNYTIYDSTGIHVPISGNSEKTGN